MCWNAEVSLNTFLFSSVALLIVWYTNTYTQYKTPLFDNPLAYVAFFSIISMQLVEFFLWRNLDNLYWNRVFSSIGLVVLFLQPLLLLLLVTNPGILLPIWTFVFCIVTVYMLGIQSVAPYTSKDRSHHLTWKWLHFPERIIHTIRAIFLVTIAYALFRLQEYVLLVFGFCMLMYSFYWFYVSKSWASVWCWIINGYFLWILIRLLCFCKM
jgi:hypothetical protein